MYKLKPINEIWPNVELPNCMYTMKTVVNLKLEETAYPSVGLLFYHILSFVILFFDSFSDKYQSQ